MASTARRRSESEGILSASITSHTNGLPVAVPAASPMA
jgi:hypothetical protein